MLVPVILSGGAGTRLWPVSREAFPKPFIRLADGESLLQKTLHRALLLPQVSHVLTVTNREYFFQTRDAYVESSDPKKTAWQPDWLLEPVGRNTAPALALAALHVQENYGGDAVMVVLPADHLINDTDQFLRSASQAVALAEEGYLVTFGIRPTQPETGFGYIEMGSALPEGGHRVARFLEKPNANRAAQFVAAGNYLWNSGMFCMRADRVLEELARHAPQLLTQAERCRGASRLADKPVTLDEASFAAMPDISFDYAVMEHTDKAVVVAAEFDWNDIGSWEAMAALGEADAQGNRSDAQTLIVDSRNCYLRSDDRLIAAVGIDDLLVIDTPDALLVAHRSKAQEVKRVALELKQQNHPLYRLHRTVHRPWGCYTVLEDGVRFKIKRIVVKPGQSLSSQMHYHRNEHWIVVQGTARIQHGETSQLLLTNQSTYIEAGTQHRLENPGITELVMIEVQSGEYLGEDDIVRFEDAYGRA